jgi:hypothetical protein
MTLAVRRPIHVDGKEVTDHFATVRADTIAVLGVVGDHAVRKIIQNKGNFIFITGCTDCTVDLREGFP